MYEIEQISNFSITFVYWLYSLVDLYEILSNVN